MELKPQAQTALDEVKELTKDREALRELWKVLFTKEDGRHVAVQLMEVVNKARSIVAERVRHTGIPRIPRRDIADQRVIDRIDNMLLTDE